MRAMSTDSSGPGRLDRAWAIAFARLVLGFIFFMAGVYKIFDLGPLGHARKWFLPFSDTFLPVWSLWAVGVAIPFVELVGGGLLLVGCGVREGRGGVAGGVGVGCGVVGAGGGAWVGAVGPLVARAAVSVPRACDPAARAAGVRAG